MPKPNLRFKMAVLDKYDHQYDAAASIGIRESRLSLIIHRRAVPTASERRCLVKAFGKDRIAELLDFFDDGSTLQVG
jgi:hypothetical protein